MATREPPIIDDSIARLARRTKDRRNDVAHANVELRRAESLLGFTGKEHEIRPIDDLSKIISADGSLSGDGETISISFGREPIYRRVYAFRAAARESLKDTQEFLKSLYAHRDEPAPGQATH